MDWRKLGRRLAFPHPAVLLTLCAFAAAMLICAFTVRDPSDPVSIAGYTLAFTSLVLLCIRIPAMFRCLQRFRRENRFYLRYRSDVQLRVGISLGATFLFSAAYALLQLCLGLWHRSAWFYATAGYHLLLAVMRLTLARHTRSHLFGEDTALEWRRYRFCGWLLLMMNLALAVFTLYFVFRIRVFRHHEVTVIAMAAYSFTALTVAIVNAVRYRRYGSPACSAAKAISLVAAIVSMLTLENAMLTTFGQESSEAFRQPLLGVSGAAVILVIQGIALYMIINAHRKLKSMR